MTEHPLPSRIVPGDPDDPKAAALAARLRELVPGEHEQHHQVIVPRSMPVDPDGLLAGVRESDTPVPMISGRARLTPPDTDDPDDTEQEGPWND